jgi:hypothetical protein
MIAGRESSVLKFFEHSDSLCVIKKIIIEIKITQQTD